MQNYDSSKYDTLCEGENQNPEITDYSEILTSLGIDYKASEFYWQAGEISKTQGWIIHLTVIKPQILELFNTVLPLLIKEGIPFKIVTDMQTAGYILDGALGYETIGKILCLYPDSDDKALMIAVKLIELTKRFKGPDIPTDLNLGGIVFTRFGSFNPVMIKDAFGQPTRQIYNYKGELVVDHLFIPFRMPKGIIWPFMSITPSIIKHRKKLLNNVYYPIEVLKPDAKGDVLKVLYFRKFWKIKACLIKQGRKNMYADMAGRDIRDRLEWQFQIYKRLKDNIPMPKVFDYFQDGDDCYLAMEYIQGISLTSWIYDNYNNSCWRDIDHEVRNLLTDCLLRIIKIIGCLHDKGYIHRDITPENFLIDKKGQIFLIDMELSWSFILKSPDPPFEMGTPGYMSPEQSAKLTPTLQDDIYALGALMVLFFTGLPITKFDVLSLELDQNLDFFIGNASISGLLVRCLSLEPSQRPTLNEISTALEQALVIVNGSSMPSKKITIQESEDFYTFRQVIDRALRGLTLPELLTDENLWMSTLLQKESRIGNDQVEAAYYSGFHTGIAGVLYLISIAGRSGFDIDSCKSAYLSGWRFVNKNYFRNTNSAIGLYNGGAGIAIALKTAMDTGLIEQDQEVKERLKLCFARETTGLDLATGLSGQGLALLHCMPYIDDDFLYKQIQFYRDRILNNQNSDGSWNLRAGKGKSAGIILGLDSGIAGIVLFLLSYLQRFQDTRTKAAVIKALSWLIKQANNSLGTYAWTLTTKSNSVDMWTLSKGLPGILLAFIKACEVFQDPSYQVVTEKILACIPPHPVRAHLSLYRGLTGLGEVFQEGHNVFKTQEWQDRIDWIFNLLLNTRITQKEATLWVPDSTNSITADLFTGISGVIHFMMRYIYPDRIKHPLLLE